jgi:FAD/FMN-containing dehydrogenase
VTAVFTNWVGNQSCTPARILAPASEADVRAAVRTAREVRCVATGHSFTPVHLTGDTLLSMDGLHGVLRVDPVTGTITALPGTSVGELGEPLWDAGFSLANQGDIDTQGIAGAISTATHGSGLALRSFSAALRHARLVVASGDVLEIGPDDPRLPAVQACIGMLGVLTEVEVQAVPAHRLVERVEQWPYQEAFGRLDELARAHRHYSFFYIPTEASAALYDLDVPPGMPVAETCYVKIYDVAPDDLPDSTEPGRRVLPAFRIYPDVFPANFHELEYFVPYERAQEALAAMRELMLASLPLSVFPMEVRTVAREDAWLSHSYDRDSLVISVSGQPGTAYEPYLRDVHAVLGNLDARVHWGKLHHLTRDELLARYPRAGDFIALRRELDPEGVFLNDHLRPLFA